MCQPDRGLLVGPAIGFLAGGQGGGDVGFGIVGHPPGPDVPVFVQPPQGRGIVVHVRVGVRSRATVLPGSQTRAHELVLRLEYGSITLEQNVLGYIGSI